MQLRALLFDLDGVIADTLSLHYESWVRMGEEYGIRFTPQDYEPMLGLPRRACLDLFLKGRAISEDTAQTMLERKNAHFHALLRNMTAADTAPGVAELIREARGARLKIALGSSSQNARLVLSKLGLLDDFDVVGDALTVTRTKPAPDIYLWAAERLNISPSDAVVFEDSGAGIEAARAGGFPVVGLGERRTVGAADVVLPSLAGVTLERLHHLLARAEN